MTGQIEVMIYIKNREKYRQARRKVPRFKTRGFIRTFEPIPIPFSSRRRQAS